ncbi:MAG: hypothetical protein JSV96_02865 [Candidatus Aminicenantes bacterium]|nr:MAG: hypothetical protein JSV96_02865 [Candidatus Aminicenantes bacterium]
MATVLSFDIGGILIEAEEAGFCSFICESLGFLLWHPWWWLLIIPFYPYNFAIVRV